ncbi:DNA polymerase III subunit beta [Olsenella profusa]|uniref:Beta sliding clamp n=1 Tax=Olsenella profusa TaxID=138595 RepID=A0ABS2F0G3_9ACTN|nr:DNA polymerase III subunit beta [Olsenella profusa]
MKFTVSQSALMKALAVVAKGMGTNSTLPILSGIYVRAGEGTLEFQTNNLTISIRHLIPANVEEPGETVVSGKVLTSIVKTLPDAAVTFDGADRNLKISCDKSTFRLNTLNPADWAAFPELAPTRTIELPSDLLSRMVDKVYRVTSRETSRPILQGILLTVEDNTIRLVATDSFRLAVCDSSVEAAPGEAFRAIVPGTVFHDVLGMPSMTDTVQIGTTDSQVVFSFGNTTFVSRRIEGNFPDYKQLLPPTCATAVELDVEAFSAALKRVSVIALQNASVRFDIDADGGLVRLSASSPEQGESTETIACEVEGQSMAIALNYHYVFDCVNAVSEGSGMRLELQGSTQPGIFKSNGKVNYLYLLMPVRL